jgi:hypothetical protein
LGGSLSPQTPSAPPGAEHERHGRDGEDDLLAVDVRAGDEHLQQQRIAGPHHRGAELAHPVAAGHVVQQQRGAGERGQVGQAEQEHGEPHGRPGGQRGQRLDAGRERPVDRRGGRPVLYRAGDGVAERRELSGRRGVRVVAGDEHPSVGGVAQVIRGPERRHQRQRGGGNQSRHDDGPRRDRPAAADRPQHEHQAERACRKPGGGEPDHQVRRRVRAERPRRLPGPAGQRGLHDRRPRHRDGERRRDADRDGDEAGGRTSGHRRAASALATSAS